MASGMAGSSARPVASTSMRWLSRFWSSTNSSSGRVLREPPGHVEDRGQRQVAVGGVGGHRLRLGDLTVQRPAQRPGEQLGVAERVGDPVPGDRVAVVAGVADERPARAGRLAARGWAARTAHGPAR